VLIDECEALLGKGDKRKATAFKAVEDFEGILILITNHPHLLDEGLERRIESSLRVRVEPDGAVAAVSFHPPLRPELQSCALFVLSLRLGAGPRELSVPIRLD